MENEALKDVNFLPEDYLERKAQQRTNVICLVLFIFVMAAVVGGFFVTEQRKKQLDDNLNTLNTRLAGLKETLQQVDALESRKKQMQNKAALSAQLIEPVPRSLLLAMITNCLPDGVCLTEFELDSKEISPPKAPPSPKKATTSDADTQTTPAQPAVPEIQVNIELTGLAQDDLLVADFIDRMTHARLLQRVNLDWSREIDREDEILREFRLTLVLPPGARAGRNDVALARQWKEQYQPESAPLWHWLHHIIPGSAPADLND